MSREGCRNIVSSWKESEGGRGRWSMFPPVRRLELVSLAEGLKNKEGLITRGTRRGCLDGSARWAKQKGRISPRRNGEPLFTLGEGLEAAFDHPSSRAIWRDQLL